MRFLMLALLASALIWALLVAPAPVRADEPPGTAEKKADEKKADEKKGEDAKSDETKEPLPTPVAAYGKLRGLPRTMPYAQRMAAMKKGAEEYLAAHKAAGAKAGGQDRYYLALLQQTAEQWEAAVDSFVAATADETVPANLRHAAANNEARLYQNSKVRDALGKAHVSAAIERLLAYAAKMTGEQEASMRGGMESGLASLLEATDRKDEAQALRIAVAERDPMMAARVYRSLIWGLLGSTHALDGYAGMRKSAEPVLTMLKAQQAKAIELTEAKLAEAIAALKESKPDALDENDNLKNKDRRTHTPLERVVYGAQSQARSAKSMLTRIEGMDKPFAMLGQPAPEWTLEHAFGDTKALADLKGKVVVMDFWATWCPWCIRSFPAIRDLLAELGDKGLVFAGVTASSSNVYSARYDLDDDLKDKATPGERVQPAARLARGSAVPDGVTTFDAEAYKAKEIEVIKEFIANHQMTWPVVMIDKAEPGPKYALGGWPHAVVLDRAGRVRYFKSGALLRDRKEAVAKFKQVLLDLLAEEAPKSN